MASLTKSRILDLHQSNLLLTAQAPALTPRGEQDFGSDEFFAPIDERIISAASEAMEAGQTHYVDVPGIGPLRAAVADYLRQTYGTAYTQPTVIVTAGIQESRFLTTQKIGEAFNSIAVPAVVHPGVRKALGVRPISVTSIEVDGQLLASLEGIRSVMAQGVRLIYLESPSRLTGATYSAEAVTEIAAMANEFDATIIWDQGLAPWTAEYASLASAAEMAARTVVIGEAFPGMGLGSWFIGYIGAPEQWIASMQSQKQIMAICTSTAAQYAALEASKLFDDSHPAQLQRCAQARQNLIDRLGGIAEILPGQAATVVALRLAPTQKEQTLARLHEAGYTVTDGVDFGAPDVLRLTVSHMTPAIDTVVRLIKGA